MHALAAAIGGLVGALHDVRRKVEAVYAGTFRTVNTSGPGGGLSPQRKPVDRHSPVLVSTGGQTYTRRPQQADDSTRVTFPYVPSLLWRALNRGASREARRFPRRRPQLWTSVVDAR